jgi:hypothetical protein
MWNDRFTFRRFLTVSALLFLLTPTITTPRMTEGNSLPEIQVGEFSTAAPGPSPPPGWKPLIFPKVPNRTEYAVVADEELSVLTREISVDLKEYPILAWRWKVMNVLQKSDVRSKRGDDYAARIYITFVYDPDRVPLWRKTKYKAGRILFGDIPIGAINYIWESKTPKGTIVDNAYTDFVKMIVIESGAENVGKWVAEERNLYEDYKRAFGEEPPLVNGVAIMTDTDNTGESATAYYGDILFLKKK